MHFPETLSYSGPNNRLHSASKTRAPEPDRSATIPCGLQRSHACRQWGQPLTADKVTNQNLQSVGIGAHHEIKNSYRTPNTYKTSGVNREKKSEKKGNEFLKDIETFLPAGRYFNLISDRV